MGKTIGILSLKGGVGKTSSVIALGSALSDFGKKVLLVDANFSAPNLGIHLNVLDPEVTLHHVLNRTANVTSAIHELENFDVIFSSIFEKIKINPLKLRDKLDVLKKKYDFIIIDSSPSLNEETLAAIFASDAIFAVTTPDYSSLSTTIKAVKFARQRKIPINGLILNKVHNKNFEIPLEDIEKTADVPVMAVIPHDINILKAQAEFTPLLEYRPKSEASQEYKKLAATLIGEKYQPFSFKNLFRITPKVQEINRDVFYERQFN